MTLETERLILREYTMDDFVPLYQIMSDPETMRHYPAPFDEEKTRGWIEWNLDNYKKYGWGLWAVVLKESGDFIGDCGITMQSVDGETFPEIGYHLRKEWQGKGLATEAAKACKEFARQKGFAKIISYMKSDNIPSRRVAERNGMKFVKSFTKEVFGKTVVDEVLYMAEI